MLGRPSRLNSSSLPDFLFDNNMSPHLAWGMCGFGESAGHLSAFFPPDTPDVVWLEQAGRQGVAVVTRDLKFAWRPIERETLRIYRVGAFYLGGKNLQHWQMVQQIVRHWPEMLRLSKETPRPFGYLLRPYGSKIERLNLD